MLALLHPWGLAGMLGVVLGMVVATRWQRARFQRRPDSDPQRPGWENEWTSAGLVGRALPLAALLGFAGSAMRSGTEAWWSLLGFVGGWAVLIAFLAPRWQKVQSANLLAFAAERYRSPSLDRILLVFVGLLGFGIAIAELKAAGILLLDWTASTGRIAPSSVPSAIGLTALGVGLVLAILAAGWRPGDAFHSVLYWFKLGALALPLAIMVYVRPWDRLTPNPEAVSECLESLTWTRGRAVVPYALKLDSFWVDEFMVTDAQVYDQDDLVGLPLQGRIRVWLDRIGLKGRHRFSGSGRYIVHTASQMLSLLQQQPVSYPKEDVPREFSIAFPSTPVTRRQATRLFEDALIQQGFCLLYDSRGALFVIPNSLTNRMSRMFTAVVSRGKPIVRSSDPPKPTPVAMESPSPTTIAGSETKPAEVATSLATPAEQSIQAPSMSLALPQQTVSYAVVLLETPRELAKAVMGIPSSNAPNPATLPPNITSVEGSLKVGDRSIPLPRFIAERAWEGMLQSSASTNRLTQLLDPSSRSPRDASGESSSDRNAPLYLLSLVLGWVFGTAGLVAALAGPDASDAARVDPRRSLHPLLLVGAFCCLAWQVGEIGRRHFPVGIQSGDRTHADAVVLEMPKLLSIEGSSEAGVTVDGVSRKADVVLSPIPWSSILAGGVAAVAITTLVATLSALLPGWRSCVVGSAVRPAARRDWPFRITALVIAAVATASAVALDSKALIVLLGQVLSVSAASCFPFLVLSLGWNGLTSRGASVGLLVGGGSAVLAILTTHISDLAGGSVILGALFQPGSNLADVWVRHPLVRGLCEQPALWALPLSLGLMWSVSRFSPGGNRARELQVP